MVEDQISHSYRTRRIESADTSSGFRCGKHELDHYFKRHALSNDRDNVGSTYVLEASTEDLEAGLPNTIGFYTISMAVVTSQGASAVLSKKLPRYPMPVALIGRLAVDERAHGRRLGESLLLDALARVVAAADIIGCLGAIVDAKDEAAESFYQKYDFVTVDDASWPRRMFLHIAIARSAFETNEAQAQ